jgi:hypothetical protein
MSAAVWSDADTTRALEVWQNYQAQHDVSAQLGKAVGIDPATGRVWFGESAEDIVSQLDAQGLATPLFFLRVGSDYYQRKGGRR